MPPQKRKSKEIVVDLEEDTEETKEQDEGTATHAEDVEDKGKSKAGGEAEPSSSRGRRGGRAGRSRGRGRGKRSRSANQAKEEDGEDTELPSRRSVRSKSSSKAKTDDSIRGDAEDQDEASKIATEEKAVEEIVEDDEEDETLTLKARPSVSRKDPAPATAQTTGKEPPPATDAPPSTQQEVVMSEGPEEPAETDAKPLDAPSLPQDLQEREPDAQPEQQAVTSKEGLITETAQLESNRQKELEGADEQEGNDELTPSKTRGLQRSKRKAHVIDDAEAEEDMNDAELDIKQSDVKVEGEWQPDQGDVVLERSLSVESDDLISIKPKKQRTTKAKVAGKSAGAAPKSARAAAKGRGGKGGRGSRSTRGQATKKETTQKAGAEVKVDAAEKKIPPLKLSLKKEAQQSVLGEATDHKSAPQEDPLLEESLSGLEIIPETLEPGQPVQSGLPAIAGHRMIEAVTSASGSKTTEAENIQERTAQILANFKICTEVFAEARSRTSKAMDQIAADVEYLDSLKINEAALQQTGVGKLVNKLSKPGSLVRPEYEKKAMALIERWRKEIERPPANASGKGQAPSQATGSQQKPASQAAPGPARAAAVGSQRPPPEAKRAPLGEPAKPSTLAGKLPAMKAEQIVRSLKPVDPKRTAIHGADVRTDLSTLPGPYQTQQSGLSSQGQAAVLDPLRERVQLILEEAFKPAEYAFLPSEAARAAEEELHSHFRDAEQSAEQPYLERLHQVLALLWPSSPQYLPGLMEFTMKGKIHPADVVSLDSEDLQALLSQAQA